MMISDLPKDLESEILVRVPAKSLQALKSTCKRWYALFKDPKFVEKNRKMSNEAARESMVLSNREVYSIAGNLHNSGDIKLSLDFTGKLSIDLDIYTISHCDGLMLCQAKYNSRLVVWNPCTGEAKMIEPRTQYHNVDRFALGYSSSSSSRSYKILRCGFYRNENGNVEWEMYDLCSDSWRFIDSFPLDYVRCCSGVSLRGDTYFVASAYEDTSDFDLTAEKFLIKFDFTAERFVRLPPPLPYQSFGTWDTVVLSVVRDEKLSVCRREIVAGSNVMRIWVTNKVDEEGKEISWRKDFVMNVDFDKFELQCVVNVSSFLLDEVKKVAVCCETYEENGEEKITIFVVGEDMYKQVYNATIKGYCPLVLTYVPSLVCIH